LRATIHRIVQSSRRLFSILSLLPSSSLLLALKKNAWHHVALQATPAASFAEAQKFARIFPHVIERPLDKYVAGIADWIATLRTRPEFNNVFCT